MRAKNKMITSDAGGVVASVHDDIFAIELATFSEGYNSTGAENHLLGDH